MHVRLSKLPPSPSQKNFRDVYEFLNEKSGSEKRKLIFCKLIINDQCFLHSFMYNGNKNIYKLIKKNEIKQKCLRLFNKETPSYAELD